MHDRLCLAYTYTMHMYFLLLQIQQECKIFQDDILGKYIVDYGI